MIPPFLPPSFTPLSSSSSDGLCLAFLCVSPFTLDQHTGLVGADGSTQDASLWSPPKLSCARNGTDDACFAPAIQWKRRRAKEEMGTVPGLSPTRSWGKCCQHTVWFVPVVVALVQLCAAFNLDTEERVVFSGPRGSYFGYSLEFFSNSSRWSHYACRSPSLWESFQRSALFKNHQNTKYYEPAKGSVADLSGSVLAVG